MSANSKIEWTDATWNPVTGCTEVSPGCDHCYAKTFAERWRGTPGHHFEQGFDVRLWPDRLGVPLRWRKPRRIFVNSMSDLFHEAVPGEFIAAVFGIMAETPQHTYQVLTKRHGRMRSLLSGDMFRQHFCFRWPLPNVWLGVSVENQKWADIRVPALLDTPAAVRFLSCEPLLGPVSLRGWLCDPADVDGSRWPPSNVRERSFDWVIAGGESGPGARPMHPGWVRRIRDDCQAARVPFHFKQWGAHRWITGSRWDEATQCWVDHGIMPQRVGKKIAGRVLDGRTWDEFPAVDGVPA